MDPQHNRMASSIRSLVSSPATIALGRRRRQHDSYQLLDKQQHVHQEEEKEGNHIGKSFSVRSPPFKLAGSKSSGEDGTGLRGGLIYPPSCSHPYHMYRMERAKKRQIFLRSYNLSFEGQRPKTVRRRLRRSFGKVKKAVLTIMAFTRMRLFSLCRGKSRTTRLPCRVFSPAPAAAFGAAPVGTVR